MATQSHKSLKRARKTAVLDVADTLRDPMASDSVLLNDIKRVLATQQTTMDQVQNKLISPAMMKRIRREDRSKEEVAVERPERELIHQKYEAEVTVSGLGADGDGIAIEEREDGEKRVLVIPFALPGDTVKVRVYKKNLYFFNSEIVEVVSKGDLRDDSLTSCKYFGDCSGCQYQFMDYAKQLDQKRNVVVNAFNYYCHTKSVLPEVGSTFPSPEVMGYRTKLTPHYDVPKTKSPEWLAAPPAYGFNMKTRGQVLDIEDCPIGTPVVRQGLKDSREDVKLHYKESKRGKTYLLRENTVKNDAGELEKTCVTDNRAIVSEYIDNYRFDFTAGEFFQNNNSILPAVTAYVRESILLDSGKPPRFLVDAYCGSGLFSITCSKAVEKVYGVEISDDSVRFARKNAELNNITNAVFLTGKAENIFKDLECDGAETCMIIDPPRKGTDQAFIDQLVNFRPQKLVYVSCNVHTQARDMAYLLEKCPDYKVESIRGFDFFPQTKHVEGVAVLSYQGTREPKEAKETEAKETEAKETETNGVEAKETNGVEAETEVKA